MIDFLSHRRINQKNRIRQSSNKKVLSFHLSSMKYCHTCDLFHTLNLSVFSQSYFSSKKNTQKKYPNVITLCQKQSIKNNRLIISPKSLKGSLKYDCNISIKKTKAYGKWSKDMCSGLQSVSNCVNFMVIQFITKLPSKPNLFYMT